MATRKPLVINSAGEIEELAVLDTLPDTIVSMATTRILGRITAGTGGYEALTPGNARTVLGLASTDVPIFRGVNIQTTATTDLSLLLAGMSQGSVTDTAGVYLRLGYNATGNRQLWLGDSAQANDVNKSSFRFLLGFALPTIDAVANDGSVARHVNLGGGSINVGIGFDPGFHTQASITEKFQVLGAVRISGVYKVEANQVVKARITGWALATGTPTRTTFATSTVTLPQLAERVKALIDDLHATAGHGLIGT